LPPLLFLVFRFFFSSLLAFVSSGASATAYAIFLLNFFTMPLGLAAFLGDFLSDLGVPFSLLLLVFFFFLSFPSFLSAFVLDPSLTLVVSFFFLLSISDFLAEPVPG
jgi:hypothetical protein